jgi:hypothetical protein
MEWGDGRGKAIAQLEERVRASGSFVDRAIVREVIIASQLFAERHSAWGEVCELVDNWEKGRPDLRILEAIRHINRGASYWKSHRPPGDSIQA